MTNYLNSITPRRRRALYTKMTKTKSVVISTNALIGAEASELVTLRNPKAPNRDGSWWKNRISCYTIPNIKPCVNGHQRWQPRLSSKLQLKLWTHHVAFATTSPEKLPENLGRGSSIDHLCGGKACCNPAHLTVALEHKSNCARIGCQGITLLAYNQNIVAEYPCPHSEEGSLEYKIKTSCLKITVLTISQQTKDTIDSLSP